VFRRIAILLVAAGGVIFAQPLVVGAAPNRQVTYDLTIGTTWTTNCSGWTFNVTSVTFNTPIIPGSNQWSGPTSHSGAWTYGSPPQETADVQLTLSAILADGTLVFVDVGTTIFEASPCPPTFTAWSSTSTSYVNWTRLAASCSMTPRYYMYTLEDANQPDSWQPYCYIISSNGAPSVEAQARVCSVPGFDHAFQATNMPYAGWVSADCLGNASYGWPAWDPDWYRAKWSTP
jgi:hypothetical protein